MSTPFLELRNVSKVFGGGFFSRKKTVALDNLSLVIDTETPGVKAIAGESGSGKSTLGLMLMGFLSPTSGQVLYRGKDVSQLSGAEQMSFRREIQAIFQDPFSVYNPFYPVDHVLNVPIRKFHLASNSTDARKLMEDSLSRVGLQPEETLGRYPHQLSGGQRQRIMVARALLLKPKLIIADEPVSMVDASLRATILETLRSLNRDFGISILYITHDLTTAYHISSDILVLYRGSVAEIGAVEHVIKDPQHPYTQLLVDSIPWPDLNHTWGQNQVVLPSRAAVTSGSGCKFADRCPHVMDACRGQEPPHYQLNEKRAAACFLHKDAPQIGSTELQRMFA